MDSVEGVTSQKDWFPDHIAGVSRTSKAAVGADLESMQAALDGQESILGRDVGGYGAENLVEYLAPSIRTTFSQRSSSELQKHSKKARLMEKLIREGNPYHLLRQDQQTLRNALDQVRSDSMQLQDNILQTKRETALAARERDLYERHYNFVRQEFSDSMSLTVSLRNQCERALRYIQSEYGESQSSYQLQKSHFVDISTLVGKLKRVEVERDTAVNVSFNLRNDIEQLQSLLAQCLQLAFNDSGSPVWPYCSIFQTQSPYDLKKLTKIVHSRAEKEEEGSQEAQHKEEEDQQFPQQPQQPQHQQDDDNDVTTENPMKKAKVVGENAAFAYYTGSTPQGVEDSSAQLTDIERAQRADMLTLHQQIVDASGVFNAGVFFSVLRKQADQIIKLQTQCSCESVRAQELFSDLELARERLTLLSQCMEDQAKQVDAARIDLSLKDSAAAVSNIELHAAQEQTGLLKGTLKQLELMKVLDEKKYQKLLQVLNCADGRATISEEIVSLLMDRVCVMKHGNDTLQNDLNLTREERDVLIEMLAQKGDSNQIVNFQAMVHKQHDQASTIQQLQDAQRASLATNEQLKQQLEQETEARMRMMENVQQRN